MTTPCAAARTPAFDRNTDRNDLSGLDFDAVYGAGVPFAVGGDLHRRAPDLNAVDERVAINLRIARIAAHDRDRELIRARGKVFYLLEQREIDRALRRAPEMHMIRTV